MKNLLFALSDAVILTVGNLAVDIKYGKKEEKKEEVKNELVEIKPKKEVIEGIIEHEPIQIHNNILDKIEKEDHELSRKLFIKKAENTEKLIRYTIKYISDTDTPKIETCDEEKQLINAIAELADYTKIYEDQPSAKLGRYDVNNNFNINNEFILSLFDLSGRICTEEFEAIVNKRKEHDLSLMEHPEDDVPEIDPNSSIPYDRMDEDGMIHPVFFGNKALEIPLVDKQGAGISDELFAILEKEIGSKIKGKSYTYDLIPNSGLVDLSIYSSGYAEDHYLIDPTGMVLGGGKVSVLANIDNGTLFVPNTQSEILQKVLDSRLYRLTPEEHQKVFIEEYFRNMSIYSFIDMSNTEFVNKLSRDEFNELGKKLTFICNLLRKSGVQSDMQLPRFRFNHFTSVDDFMIISDFDVKSPLAFMGMSSGTIAEGVMFIVEKDKVSWKYRDDVQQYSIEKYNEM